MIRSGEKGQQTDGGNGTDGGRHSASRRVRPRVSSLGVVAFQQRVANNDDRKAALPEHVDPSAGLRAAPSRPLLENRPGKVAIWGNAINEVKRYPLARTRTARN